MDKHLRKNLERLKTLGKEKKHLREPLLRELTEGVFGDMLEEIQYGTILMQTLLSPPKTHV